MKQKIPNLTPQQKAQILGDNPPSLATAIKKLPLRALLPDSPSKQSALKTHIVCFGLDGEPTVRIEARNSIEAAGRAYQSRAAQMVLKGKWPLRCRVIAVASLPQA